eukprot:Skav218245  [mRNA]  locus=scaffold1426:100017:103195:- [translate_table: standard]
MILSTTVMNISQDVQPDDNFEAVPGESTSVAHFGPAVFELGTGVTKRAARRAQSLRADVIVIRSKTNFLGPDDNSDAHSFTLANFILQDEVETSGMTSALSGTAMVQDMRSHGRSHGLQWLSGKADAGTDKTTGWPEDEFPSFP